MKKKLYLIKTENHKNKGHFGCSQKIKKKLWNPKILIKSSLISKYHKSILIYRKLKYTNKFQLASEAAKFVKN